MIDTPETPTREQSRAAHNDLVIALMERALRTTRDADEAYYADATGATTETTAALSHALFLRRGALMELSDLLFDALHPQAPFVPASRGPQLAALDDQIAALRRELAGTRAEAAKWRGTMDRKLAQLGGRTMTASGIAAAFDHNGDHET